MSQPDRVALSRVIAVANGKGGVGKTSFSTNLAGLVAARGQSVLLVDLDPQGNAGDDLGYNAAGYSDGGAGLTRAVQFGDDPYIIKDVRSGLDVIPGGAHLDDLTGVLTVRRDREGEATTALSLANALAPTVAGYDLTVLDCPPRHAVLQTAALAMARYLLIPTKTDLSSRMGLEEMARRFNDALPINPQLRLLGVLLFGVTSSAKKVRGEARAWVDNALGGQAPVFKAMVRHVEGPAVAIRDRGQLPHELELGPASGATVAMGKAAAGLAADYQAAAVETMTALLQLEQITMEVS